MKSLYNCLDVPLSSNLEERPLISICMAVYNASLYIRDCLDSILTQTYTNFELVIVDDGSDDDTIRIIESYQDERIILIRNRHDYIDSLNMSLLYARGKYVARMDADDKMLPDRLRIQCAYMEKNPDVDVLSGCLQYVDAGSTIPMDSIQIGARLLNQSDFLYSNPIAHPTSFLRRRVLNKNGIRYSRKYRYAEDYALWCDCILAGMKMVILDIPVLFYRISQMQVSVKYAKEMLRSSNLIKKDFARHLCMMQNPCYKRPYIKESTHQVTAIIPFLNEGMEVVNTVRSLRQIVGREIDIILINDQSTDGFHYQEELSGYDVYYVVNFVRKGVAASRDYGVSLCKTKYFVLLDAHMRFYDGQWLTDVCNLLNKDERQLLCMQCKQLWKNDDGTISELHDATRVYGAYLVSQQGKLCPQIEWNYSERDEICETECIAAVLGAGYIASKQYWTYLRGLKGLEQYGCDEAYISLKVWTEGGRCVLVKNHEFGHIYRSKSPYSIQPSSYIYNYLLVAYTIFPAHWWLWTLTSCQIANYRETMSAVSRIITRKHLVNGLRDYYRGISHRSLDAVWRLQHTTMLQSRNRMVEDSKMMKFVYRNIRTVSQKQGVVDGNMGRWIWNLHYAASLHQKYNYSHFFDAICKSIQNKELPVNFKNGLAGIGWGLIYLQQTGFIDAVDDWIFNAIDEQVEGINVGSITDASFYYGIGGIIAYVINRIGYCNENKKAIPWTPDFMSTCIRRARNLVNHPNDFASILHARFLLVWHKNPSDNSWYSPNMFDWVRVEENMPKNLRYWTFDFDSGCLGYSMRLMKTQVLYNKKSEL